MAVTLAELVMKVRLENKVVLQELKSVQNELKKVQEQSKNTEKSVSKMFQGISIGKGALGIAAISQGIRALGEFGEKLRSVNKAFEEGKISASEWRAAAFGAVPLFGSAYSAGEQFSALFNPSLAGELDARDKMKEQQRTLEENQRKLAEAQERNRQKRLDDLEKERKLQQEIREETLKNARDAKMAVAEYGASPEMQDWLQYQKEVADIQEWIVALQKEYNQALKDAGGDWWKVRGSLEDIDKLQKDLLQRAGKRLEERKAERQKEEDQKRIRQEITILEKRASSIEVGRESAAGALGQYREYLASRDRLVPAEMRGPVQAMNRGSYEIPSITMPAVDGIDKLVDTSVQQLAELRKINTTLQTKKATLG